MPKKKKLLGEECLKALKDISSYTAKRIKKLKPLEKAVTLTIISIVYEGLAEDFEELTKIKSEWKKEALQKWGIKDKRKVAKFFEE